MNVPWSCSHGWCYWPHGLVLGNVLPSCDHKLGKPVQQIDIIFSKWTWHGVATIGLIIFVWIDSRNELLWLLIICYFLVLSCFHFWSHKWHCVYTVVKHTFQYITIHFTQNINGKSSFATRSHQDDRFHSPPARAAKPKKKAQLSSARHVLLKEARSPSNERSEYSGHHQASHSNHSKRRREPSRHRKSASRRARSKQRRDSSHRSSPSRREPRRSRSKERSDSSHLAASLANKNGWETKQGIFSFGWRVRRREENVWILDTQNTWMHMAHIQLSHYERTLLEMQRIQRVLNWLPFNLLHVWSLGFLAVGKFNKWPTRPLGLQWNGLDLVCPLQDVWHLGTQKGLGLFPIPKLISKQKSWNYRVCILRNAV